MPYFDLIENGSFLGRCGARKRLELWHVGHDFIMYDVELGKPVYMIDADLAAFYKLS